MIRLITCFVTGLALCFALSLPAKAVNVTVGGVIYDVTFSATAVDYNTVETSVEATPWFGNQTLTLAIATEFVSVTGGDFGITPTTMDGLFFAFRDNDPPNPAGGAQIYFANETAGVNASDFNFAKNSTIAPQQAFALGTIVGTVDVPEINGASLVQAMFVLMALALLLTTHRLRQTP